MDEAILSSDRSVSDVRDLSARQQSLQTGFIMNENRVNSARDAAVAAKDLVKVTLYSYYHYQRKILKFLKKNISNYPQASSANAELYQLNSEFKNVSSSLDVKTNDIGRAKDLAVDLQRRANELATSASNKMANIYGRLIYFNHSDHGVPGNLSLEMNDISGKELRVVLYHKLLTVPLRVGHNFLAFEFWGNVITASRILSSRQNLEQNKTTPILEAEGWVLGKVVALTFDAAVLHGEFRVVEVSLDNAVNILWLCCVECHDLIGWDSFSGELRLLCVKLRLQVPIDDVLDVIDGFVWRGRRPHHGVVLAPEVRRSNCEVHPFCVIWVERAVGIDPDFFKPLGREN